MSAVIWESQARSRGHQCRWQIQPWFWHFPQAFPIVKQGLFYLLSVKVAKVHCLCTQQFLRIWYNKIPNFSVIFYVTKDNRTVHYEECIIISPVWAPWWENTSYEERASLGKEYPDEERLPDTVGISHSICQLKRKRKHRAWWCTHSSSSCSAEIPCASSLYEEGLAVAEALASSISLVCAEALLIHCAIWIGAHGSQSCHIYSMLSLGRWSDSLSRAPGRSCKQLCLTNPGSVWFALFHLSYHACLVPAAHGMGSQWCWLHEGINKTVPFLKDSKRIHSCLWSQVWENLSKQKSLTIISHAPAEQNTNLCRNLVWPLTHKSANHKD